jgi:hypothetical protein
MLRYSLIDLAGGWPRFDPAPERVEIPLGEYEWRLGQLRDAMAARDLSHLVIYGDREHCANLLWACGFDPRFEEALLIVGRTGAPILLTGNECPAYLPISPLWDAGQLRSEVYQPFSLLDQPRSSSRALSEILRNEGMNSTSRVGCVGWKYYGARARMDLPSYIVDDLRGVSAVVEDATDILMNPSGGLRSVCSAAEIAFFEHSNWKASEAMRRVFFAAREGMTDFEMLSHAGYDGTPLSCHMTLKTGPRRISLASPSGARLERGHPWSANIAYWGSNVCRANWVAESAADLPETARDYVEAFAGPYFEAMGEWLAALRIGEKGGRLTAIVQQRLPFEKFGIFLNEGHLIHYDEWLSSPIYAGSELPIRSGMVFQTDVIPSSKRYFSTRMEDGLAIAGTELRASLKTAYPAVMARIDARRQFAIEVLGLPLAPEHLPLSNTFGIVAPFLLRPHSVFALAI